MLYLKVEQLCRQGWVGLPKLMILVFYTGSPLQEKGIPLVATPQSIHLEASEMLCLSASQTVPCAFIPCPSHRWHALVLYLSFISQFYFTMMHRLSNC